MMQVKGGMMRRFSVFVALTALLMAVMAAPSLARPGEIEGPATVVFVEEIDPGHSWLTGDVLHVRDVVWYSRVEGTGANAEYITGDQTSEFGFDWNYKTGALHTVGTFEVTLDAFDGGYEGSFVIAGPPNPDAVGGVCAEFPMFNAVAQGFGDLEGAQYRWDAHSDTCAYFITADVTVFFPGA
jgi:hypothetical protein